MAGWRSSSPLDPEFLSRQAHGAWGVLPRSGIADHRDPGRARGDFHEPGRPGGFLFRFIAATNATDGTALDSGTLSVAQIDAERNYLGRSRQRYSLARRRGRRGPGGGGFALRCARRHRRRRRAIAAVYLACAGNPARDRERTRSTRARATITGISWRSRSPNGDVTAKTFSGSLAIVGGQSGTAPLTQYTHGSNAWLTKPRTLNLDGLGQLWIGTDQRGRVTRHGGRAVHHADRWPQHVSARYCLSGTRLGRRSAGRRSMPPAKRCLPPSAIPAPRRSASFDAPGDALADPAAEHAAADDRVGLVSPYDATIRQLALAMRICQMRRHPHNRVRRRAECSGGTGNRRSRWRGCCISWPSRTACRWAPRGWCSKPGMTKIGRVAVLREARGLGVGAALMREIETAVPGRDFILDAQVHAMAFYERLGYARRAMCSWRPISATAVPPRSAGLNGGLCYRPARHAFCRGDAFIALEYRLGENDRAFADGFYGGADFHRAGPEDFRAVIEHQPGDDEAETGLAQAVARRLPAWRRGRSRGR